MHFIKGLGNFILIYVPNMIHICPNICLGSNRLLKKPKTKAQTRLVHKQTNINKIFIDLSSSHL